jgi:hypothetical protein
MEAVGRIKRAWSWDTDAQPLVHEGTDCERTVCNGRTTARRPLTDAALSNRPAEESQAR